MIPLGSVDAAELRVGMKATLLRGSEVVARAVLEDVGREESRARVLSVAETDVELGVDVRVQFSARFS
jgi:hypothetical protein